MEEKAKPVIRATATTQRCLKMIAAMTGETMQAVLARLVQQELVRLQSQE